jgi:hypothetical protein
MNSDIVRQFHELCRKALWASDTHDSAEEIEPYLVAVLEFVLAHPEEKDSFLQYLLHAFDGPSEPVAADLHAFCMRELRWPEIRERAFHEFRASNVPGSEFWLRGILEAYEDRWVGDEMYAYYKAKGR